MRELGMDVASIDQQYELSKKPVKEEEVAKGPAVKKVEAEVIAADANKNDMEFEKEGAERL